MKAITAMIQPFVLNKVTTALEAIEDFPGMVVSYARGLVRKRGLHNPQAQIGAFKTRAQTGEVDERRAGATLTLLIFNDFRVFQLASRR